MTSSLDHCNTTNSKHCIDDIRREQAMARPTTPRGSCRWLCVCLFNAFWPSCSWLPVADARWSMLAWHTVQFHLTNQRVGPRVPEGSQPQFREISFSTLLFGQSYNLALLPGLVRSQRVCVTISITSVQKTFRSSQWPPSLVQHRCRS